MKKQHRKNLELDDEFCAAEGYPLTMRHNARDTTDVHNEFCGLDECAGCPIEGRVAPAKIKCKSAWRKSCDSASARHFSGMKMLMNGIEKRCKNEGVGTDAVLEELDRVSLEKKLFLGIAGLSPRRRERIAP